MKNYLEIGMEIIKNPLLLIVKCKSTPLFRWIPDKKYIELYYRAALGKKLNLDNPKTFNEKLQWLKLYDRKEEYSTLADKYEVREYVLNTLGEQYLVPLVGGPWERFDDIDFSKLPEKFVLKCTHDSGSVFICKDKSNFDLRHVKKRIDKAMKKNYFYAGREWSYKDIKPRIVAEKYMVDESGYELKDYKIFCFNGIPKMIQVDYGRFSEHKRNLYTTDWEYIPVEIKYPTDSSYIIPKPICLDEMLKVATVLSKKFIHVRVDLYAIENRVYFGELTFYHGSGCEIITPPEFAYTMGDWMDITGGNKNV